MVDVTGGGLGDRVPHIVRRFQPKFAACDALYEFARANRPEDPPTDDAAGRLIFRTYGRSSKSYQAAVRLAAIGYGVQSGMIGRSLFEDMLVAHWLRRFPEKALELFERHRRASLAALVALARQHWTGKTMRQLLADVEDEWKHEIDRRLIHQAHDLFHFFNNQLLHHTSISLGIIAGEERAGRVPIELGPHMAYVGDALMVAFVSYSNTMSLVLDEERQEELSRLTTAHIKTFVSVLPRPRPEDS